MLVGRWEGEVMDKAEFYREARTDLTGPLAAVRVLEATTTWPDQCAQRSSPISALT
jgi:hypothetical protein